MLGHQELLSLRVIRSPRSEFLTQAATSSYPKKMADEAFGLGDWVLTESAIMLGIT